MNAENRTLLELDRYAREIARAVGPAEVFKVLLQASRALAPRVAVFLIRRGQVRGWGSIGYSADVAETQRRFSTPVENSGLRGLDQSDETGLMGTLDFGQPPADENSVFAVRVKGKPIALLLAERHPDESPWRPAAIGLLLTPARLRLELDLALRKLEAGTAPAATVAATAPAPTPTPELEPAELEPAEPPVDTPTDSPAPVLDAARRYARLVATDIRLYNEEAVVLGRRNGDLLDRLGDQIDRGKETFLRRHGDLGPTGIELLHEAFVQVLAAGNGELIPQSTLD